MNVPTDAALLVKNLRFLDLDLSQQWPDLNASTFRAGKSSQVTQKHRIKCAEFVLFKLFELWDPVSAKFKLGPFYPALEPRQSIKLRAVLYQMLNQLKLDGVLPRECILRKTMLDECVGERFEEVLFFFSTIVLRKVLRERQKSSQGHRLATSTIGLGTMLPAEEEVLLSPLILSLHHSLQQSLREREQTRTHLSRLSTRFREVESDLEARKSAADTSLKHHQNQSSEVIERQDTMKQQLQDDHNDDREWLDLTLDGDADEGRAALTEDRFENIWKTTLNGVQSRYDDAPKGLLADLESRVKTQKARIEYWRQFQNQVSQRNEELVVIQSPLKSPTKLQALSPKKLGMRYDGLTPLRAGHSLSFTPSIKTPARLSPSKMEHSRGYAESHMAPDIMNNSPDVQDEEQPQVKSSMVVPDANALLGGHVEADTRAMVDPYPVRPQTPTEALFADDADPSSVFKSRSKLRQTISQSMKAPWDD